MTRIPFIGRTDSLAALKRLRRKKIASMVVVRGRRRIGKSRLVEEFAKGQHFYVFSGLPPTEKTNAQSQKDEFARQLGHQLGIPSLRGSDWGDLFTILANYVKEKKTIILLDEISWMGSLDPTFLGKLKIAWDMHFSKNAGLILVLCGSVSSWIEKNIISSTGFFGRISQKIILDELSLSECNLLLEAIGFHGSAIEKFMLLSITGGVPWYLELINPGISAAENIKHLCFEKDGVLFDEFRQIFHDLFGRRNETYQRIVRILVDGPKDYKELSKALNYASGGPLSEYLNELVLSGYVEKDFNWSIKSGRESRSFQYRLGDNYLRFFLKYIQPNYNKIIKGHFIKKPMSGLSGWDSIMGFQFENLVLRNRKFILEKLDISPSDVVYDNPFFQRKTKKQLGCQIDYLIQTKFRTLYLCEIKFSKSPITSTVMNEVQEKMNRLKISKGFSCLPVLIHVNGCNEVIEKSDFFVQIIDFKEYLHSMDLALMN